MLAGDLEQSAVFLVSRAWAGQPPFDVQAPAPDQHQVPAEQRLPAAGFLTIAEAQGVGDRLATLRHEVDGEIRHRMPALARRLEGGQRIARSALDDIQRVDRELCLDKHGRGVFGGCC